MGRDESPQSTLYACKCLNVKLRSTPLVDSQPNVPSAPEYTPVYVGQDEDIEIVYPHLTLRTRKRGPFVPDPTLCARYTSLTCLCCQVLVYRIHQIVSTNDEFNLKEGPIITKGWAETVVLRSSSGWVEVHHDVLTGEAIRRQESSPQYSQLFKIVLPTTPTSPPPTETPTEQSSSILNSIPKYQLPPIPPVFPEAKATQSLFAVLASVATHKSSSTRSSVEEYIDGVVREKVAEIERTEAQLKREVQLLLNRYNEGIKRAEQEQSALDQQNAQAPASASTSNHVPTPTSPSSPKFSGIAASVIRDFVPVRPPQHSRNVSVPPVAQSAPRVSALSASLATSSFHHPRAQHDAQSFDSASARSRTPDTSSSITLTSPLANPDVRNVFQFRRTANDDINTAASYRYFLLEEEMEKRKQAEKKPEERPAAAGTSSQAGPSTTKKKSKDNKGKDKEGQIKESRPSVVNGDQTLNESSPSPKSKGKRKVTFDIQVNHENVERKVDIMDNVDAAEMMFDLEEEIGGQSDGTNAVLPLVEQPMAPVRHTRPRKRSSAGLPQSFTGLRPESLPAPSNLPLRSQAQITSQSSTSNSFMAQLDSLDDDIPISSDIVPNTEQEEDTFADESAGGMERVHDEKILNMLAASVPSHRAAWKNDNQLYETFVRRNRLLNDDEDNFDEFDEEEVVEDEEDDGQTHTGIPGSVPVQIVRRSSKPQPAALSLASYQPDSLLSSQSVPAQSSQLQRRPSSTIRRAAYAERDLERGIDPGALDFVAEEENEDDRDEESAAHTSREKAQRILEARSQVPADGMLHSMI
ncbi:hypothetical protein VKT23_001699 [Stygiomarasmius scandens]|uniref:Uncharacterized protein n=1 Tax=Marasmiellus scandens TaxID=2682957 RepID=A0ABR1K5W6_9AGAR